MLKSTALNAFTRQNMGTGAIVMLVAFGLWGCARDESGPTESSDQPASLQFGAGQPNLDSVLAVHRRHTMRLIKIPGVVGTGVGLMPDGRPGIQIFLSKSGVRGLPTTLEGVPVGMLVTGVILARPAQDVVTPKTCGYLNCTTSSAWPTPVPIGVSSGANGLLQGLCANTGTVGARVVRVEVGGNHIYALSNNHVFALENTMPVGTNELQPGRYDTPSCSGTGSTVIGTLTEFHTIAFCGSTCPNNVIDAAIASTDATKLDNWTGPTGYGVPNSVTRAAALGLGIQKYGRTTMLTTGSVTAIDATITVGYVSGTARFVHQIMISNCGGNVCGGPGDSGSLWVTNDASKNPVGLLFAGNQANTIIYANPIDSVLNNFGAVHVDNSPAPTASNGFVGGCVPNESCSDISSITASGNTITLHDFLGNTGTITLSGATASGGLTGGCVDGSCSSISSITTTGGHAITLHDFYGNTGTITLSGAVASGGLTGGCVNGSCVGIHSATGSGTKWLTLTDQLGNTGYVRLSF